MKLNTPHPHKIYPPLCLAFLSVQGHLFRLTYEDIGRSLAEGHACLVASRYGADKLKRLYGNRVLRLYVNFERSALAELLQARGFDREAAERELRCYERNAEYIKHCGFVLRAGQIDCALFELAKTIGPILECGCLASDS